MPIWSILSLLTASASLIFLLVGLDPLFTGHWLAVVSLMSLFPVCLKSGTPESDNATRALVTYQFIGIFLFVLGTTSLIASTFQALLLQSTGILFRLLTALSSPPFLFIVASLPRPQRFLFYFSSLAPFIFLSSTFLDSALVTILLSVAVPICALALSLVTLNRPKSFASGRIFTMLEDILVRSSRVCDRALGPIIVEWVVFRFLSLLWTSVRISSRIFSYATLQRHFATSLLLLLFLLLLILRHPWH